jgi:DNA-binding HTH domain-containing proteins
LDVETQPPRLSPRELDVLFLLAAGDRPARIASLLGIKEVTVHLHIRSARTKLGAATREAAVARAVNYGLITVAN